MSFLPTSNGIPYMPDGFVPEPPSREPRRWWWQAVTFLLVFAMLQGLYDMAAVTWVQRLFVETLGSRPAAALVRTISPDIAAQAIGARIAAPGGGITIRGGCEGTEVLFLLIAAFGTAALPWRRKLLGIALGSVLVFVCNQARILSLFYAYRSDPAWFDSLHTIDAPIIFIGIVALYFYAWIRADTARV